MLNHFLAFGVWCFLTVALASQRLQAQKVLLQRLQRFS